MGVQGSGPSGGSLSLTASERGVRDMQHGRAGPGDHALLAAGCLHLPDSSAIKQGADTQILRLLPTKSCPTLTCCKTHSPACRKYVLGAGICSRFARSVSTRQGREAPMQGGRGAWGRGLGLLPVHLAHPGPFPGEGRSSQLCPLSWGDELHCMGRELGLGVCSPPSCTGSGCVRGASSPMWAGDRRGSG